MYTWMKKCCLLSVYLNKRCGAYFIFVSPVRRLFEGRTEAAALIQGRRVLTFPLHMRHLIEGVAYSGAALIQVNTVSHNIET